MTPVKNESAQCDQDTCIRRDKFNRSQLENSITENANLTMQLAQADVRVAVMHAEKTEIILENRRLQRELHGREERIEELEKENLKLRSGKNLH